MSLKKETKQIFLDYGLGEDEITVYHAYLGIPQATISEISIYLSMEYDRVVEITGTLEEKKFLRKIDGIVVRYIPLEPYFELYNAQTQGFREEIATIKDNVLADQSAKFENLEKIEADAVSEVETAVSQQIDKFFQETDNEDQIKKDALMEKRTNFENTGKDLEKYIQNITFAARDRFNKTSKALEQNLQQRLFATRDHYEKTNKELEENLHSHLEKNYAAVEKEVDGRNAEAARVWDEHSSKFTQDNNELNGTLEQISEAQNQGSKTMEQELHGTMDGLNEKLKGIATSYVDDFDQGIQEGNNTINQIISDLLTDFKKRLQNLEMECKQDLDNHVQYHKDNEEKLKPTLEEILERYILRMDEVLDELKKTISALLLKHVDHVNATTQKLKNGLNTRIESRHEELSDQVNTFRENTTFLIDKLKETSDKMGNLSEILSSRGSAWKALFLGQHKFWVEIFESVEEKIMNMSDTMKENFEKSTEDYIAETKETTANLTTEITEVTAKEYEKLKGNTDNLDQEQQDKINAELRGLADELSNETNETMKRSIEHCQSTTVKLKDSIEKNMNDHQEQFVHAIKRHNQTALDHNNSMNSTVKSKNDTWYSEMDMEFSESKNKVSSEIDGQVNRINKHLNETKEKNDKHSAQFEKDKEQTKESQNQIFGTLKKTVRTDIDECKTKISTDVDEEISKIKADTADADAHQTEVLDKQIEFFENEISEIDQKQHQEIDKQIADFHSEAQNLEDRIHKVLEDHKAQYQENATTLQDSLINTIQENVQNVKDAIADFTLQFMNAIDEATELSENNEAKLTEIFQFSQDVAEIPYSTTWHVIGRKALLAAANDIIWRTKSSIIIVTPQVEDKILELLSQAAYQKRTRKYFYTSQWDLQAYAPIIEKMKQFGNVNFRNLRGAGEFYAITRDAEEVLLAPTSSKDEEMIAIVSNQEGYCKLYSSMIGPTFQANSRPI